MKNKKVLLLSIISISVLFILSGCSNAGISLSLSPNPVEFSEDQTKQDLALTVKTEGLGNISLDQLIVEVIDEDGQNIFRDTKDIDISEQFIIGGFSKTESYTLDLENVFKLSDYDNYTTFPELYDRLLKNKSHKLRLTVTGSNDSSLTVQINYN
jgi:hypothetical protein